MADYLDTLSTLLLLRLLDLFLFFSSRLDITVELEVVDASRDRRRRRLSFERLRFERPLT